MSEFGLRESPNGLVLHGDGFLMPVERDLLRAVLLDVDGAGALRMSVDSPVGNASAAELAGLSDVGLIGRFNEYADTLLSSAWLMHVYDICRPEVRILLSNAPMEDLRYWRERHSTGLADDDMERAARFLIDAGLFDLLEGGCVSMDMGVARMFVRAVLGVGSPVKGIRVAAAARAFRDSWADLVLSFPVVVRVHLGSGVLEDVAVALAHAVLSVYGMEA